MLNVKVDADTESGEEKEGFVILPRGRYDNLVEIESRVSAVMDAYRVLGDIEVQSIFAILGYTKDARDKIARDRFNDELTHYQTVADHPDWYSDDESAEAKKWLEEHDNENS